MNSETKIIVITGAESTGKSTLTIQLANVMNSPFVPEIARDFIESLNRKYTYHDVEHIAMLQIENMNKIRQLNSKYVFVDTWLIITKVWFEFVYQKVPDWLIDEIQKTKIDHFLVCDTDLPWIYDPVRENGGSNRRILHNLYIENIVAMGFRYSLVTGAGNDRLTNAINFLGQLK